MRSWILALVLGPLGLALGAFYGWILNPVRFVDTTPASLREDYKADFVLMVAESYHSGRDLELARRQLSVLGTQAPATLCAQAAVTAREAPYPRHDLELILELQRAMEAVYPGTAPAESAQ